MLLKTNPRIEALSHRNATWETGGRWLCDLAAATASRFAEIDAWLLLATARAGVLPEEIANRCMLEYREPWCIDGETWTFRSITLQVDGRDVGVFNETREGDRFGSWCAPSLLLSPGPDR